MTKLEPSTRNACVKVKAGNGVQLQAPLAEPMSYETMPPEMGEVLRPLWRDGGKTNAVIRAKLESVLNLHRRQLVGRLDPVQPEQIAVPVRPVGIGRHLEHSDAGIRREPPFNEVTFHFA